MVDDVLTDHLAVLRFPAWRTVIKVLSWEQLEFLSWFYICMQGRLSVPKMEGSGEQTYFALDYNTNVKKSGGHTQNCIPCWYEFVYPECRKPRPRECVEICSYTYTLKIVFDPGISVSQTSKPNADFMQILFLPVITGINKEWPMHVRPLGITV